MFGKLLAIVLAFGIVGCVLLVNRQQRIEAAHEMSLIHRRLADYERTIWRLRADIAQRCSPERIREARELLGDDWQPVLFDDAVHRGGAPRMPTLPGAPADGEEPDNFHPENMGG